MGIVDSKIMEEQVTETLTFKLALIYDFVSTKAYKKVEISIL